MAADAPRCVPADAQTDGPVTSEVLDFLCGPTRQRQPVEYDQRDGRAAVGPLPVHLPLRAAVRMRDGSQRRRPRTNIVDGGYADNTGIGMLLALWLKLAPLIAVAQRGLRQRHDRARLRPGRQPLLRRRGHRTQPRRGGARPAADQVPTRSSSTTSPCSNRRPEPSPATCQAHPIGATSTADAGRFVSISPSTTPGLPAPLAWTLSRLATADLNQQRVTALEKASAESIGKWATSGVVCQ